MAKKQVSKKKSKPNLKTARLTPKDIRLLEILRANGMSYLDIADLTGRGYGTIQKYCNKVAILPKSQQQNPFERISMEKAAKVAEARVPTSENLMIAEGITDINYWIEEHEEGTRFKAPPEVIFRVPLEDLQKMMYEPTHYSSKLPIRDWMNYYLTGKSARFLKYAPHSWTSKQLDLFDLWNEHRQIMMKIHRDFGKSMIADGVLVYEICENPNNNYTIGSEKKGKAAARVKHVGDTLLTNPLIIADYGFLPHITRFGGTRQRWTRDEITVKRDIHQTDPTLTCFSYKGADVTGAHFNGVVYDDIWSRKLELNSEVNKEKFLSWYDGELEGCLEDAWELWIYTRKGVNDVYRHFEEKQFYVVYKLPAILKYPTEYEYLYKEVNGEMVFDRVDVITDDWKISDDERFTVEQFLTKKLKSRAIEFESEWQLNPMAATGKYWTEKNLRYFDSYAHYYNLVEKKRRNSKLRVIGAMDLAYGKSARADYTSLAIIGIFENKYYVLDVFIKRGASENEMVKMMADAYKTFNKYANFGEIYVESDFWQSDKISRLKKKTPFITIKPVLARQEQAQLQKEDSAKRVNLNGKTLRIWTSLEGLIEDNRLWINKNMRNLKEFEDEFRTFPSCTHFDVLDSISMGVMQMTKKAALVYALSGS